MRAVQLKEQWERVKDTITPDVNIPEEPREPEVPSVNQTQLGRTKKRKFDETIASGDMLGESEIREMITKLTAMTAEKGLQITAVLVAGSLCHIAAHWVNNRFFLLQLK